jgi:hypothetical protein
MQTSPEIVLLFRQVAKYKKRGGRTSPQTSNIQSGAHSKPDSKDSSIVKLLASAGKVPDLTSLLYSRMAF